LKSVDAGSSFQTLTVRTEKNYVASDDGYFIITGGRSSTSVNGDIANQWEWSNFDHS